MFQCAFSVVFVSAVVTSVMLKLLLTRACNQYETVQCVSRSNVKQTLPAGWHHFTLNPARCWLGIQHTWYFEQ